MTSKFTAILCLLYILVVISSSCRKSVGVGPTPIPVPAEIMVKKLQASESDFYTYAYNSQNNVTQYVSQWQSSVEGSITRMESNYTYENNKLKLWTTQGGRTEYKYTGNTLSNSTSYYPNGSKMAEHQFQFDGSNRITTLIETIAQPVAGGPKKVKLVYSYYPDGNLRQLDTYIQLINQTDFELSSSRVYVSYDNKKNPEPANIAGHFLPGVHLHYNNPTLIRDINAGDNHEQLLQVSYTYNAAGYPSTREQQIVINGTPKPPISFAYVY